MTRAVAILAALVLAAPALADTPRERLAKLAEEVFEYDEVESGHAPKQALNEMIIGRGGWSHVRIDEADELGEGSFTRFFSVEVRIAEARLLETIEHLEATPRPFMILELSLTRDEEKPKHFRGTMRLTTTGFDVAEVSSDAQAERMIGFVEKFLKERHRYAKKFAKALEAKDDPIVRLRIDPEKRDLEVKRAPQTLKQAGGGDRRREPRPKIRPAREVLEDLAKERFFPLADLAANAPKQEIERLAEGRYVEIRGVELVTATAGPLATRLYDARAWLEDEALPRVAADLALVERAMALVGLDLADDPEAKPPPPPLAEMRPTRPLAGTLRIEAMGLNPARLTDENAQPSLEEARAWLDDREALGRAAFAAVRALEGGWKLRRLLATRERLEIRLSGMNAEKAEVSAETIADIGDVAAVYGMEAKPEVRRQGDTFVIGIDRKP